MTIQHKAFDIAQQADGWIMASAPNVDRDADRVMPMGIDCENYRKNPVLIFGHSYSDPASIIGKAAEIAVDETGLRILPELRTPATPNDPMHIVKALWDAGILRAASIGFRPINMVKNAFGGNDILACELLEVSIVPIPANQSALRLVAKAMGDDPDEDKPKALPPDEEMPPEEPPVDVPAEDVPEEMPPEDAPEDVPDEANMMDMLELRLTAILSDFLQSIRSSLEAAKP
jgi:HK97 family phage prohead protease